MRVRHNRSCVDLLRVAPRNMGTLVFWKNTCRNTPMVCWYTQPPPGGCTERVTRRYFVCVLCVVGGFLTHRQTHNIFYQQNQPIIDRFRNLPKVSWRDISLRIHTYSTYFFKYPHPLYTKGHLYTSWHITTFDINLVKMFFSFLQRNFRHEKVSVCKCFSVYPLVYK